MSDHMCPGDREKWLERCRAEAVAPNTKSISIDARLMGKLAARIARDRERAQEWPDDILP